MAQHVARERGGRQPGAFAAVVEPREDQQAHVVAVEPGDHHVLHQLTDLLQQELVQSVNDLATAVISCCMLLLYSMARVIVSASNFSRQCVPCQTHESGLLLD